LERLLSPLFGTSIYEGKEKAVRKGRKVKKE
jgi:hypothetical protein